MTADPFSHRDDAGEVRNYILGGTLHGPVFMGRDFIFSFPRPELTGRPVSLPPRPTLLHGRDDMLAVLYQRLSEGDARWPRIVTLHGLGGVGKTSVAIEYAHRHQAGLSSVWWFAANDRITLEAGFGRLAALIAAAGGPGDPRDPVAVVHAVLADSRLPWLLIFDNAPDPDSVREFLPPAGRGQVLITSQHALWPPGQGIDVPVLDAETAAGLLTSRSGDPDQGAALELAGELGGLPLALEQAAAYVQATSSTLASYLRLFRQRHLALLAVGQAPGHPPTVTATFGLALNRLQRESPVAVVLLQLLACLAPEPVPLTLLLQAKEHNGATGVRGRAMAAVWRKAMGDVLPLTTDQVTAAEAVTALRRYSLVTSAGDGMILVHLLVQFCALGRLKPKQIARYRAVAALLTEAAIPADAYLPDAWPACAALLPHALATLSLTSSRMWRLTSSGLGRLANYLGASGSYSAARDLWQAIADACMRARGPEHQATLIARLGHATMTGTPATHCGRGIWLRT